MSAEIQVPQQERPSSRLGEILNPRVFPEAGFQSYNMLANDAPLRKEPFLAGAYRNPAFIYGRFEDISEMDRGIIRIAEATETVDRLVQDPQIAAATKSSLEYRMAEMDYVKLLAQLDYVLHESGDQDVARELYVQAQEVGEALYGKVDPETRDAALNQVWGVMDDKQFEGKAAQLFNDLRYGFTSAEGFEISGMRRADNLEAKLPEFDEAITWAGEHFEEDNADIEAVIHKFWQEKVDQYGHDYECDPEDIVEALRRVVDLMDPQRLYGIGVELVEGKTSLSWETPRMQVQVGALRKPIKKERTLFTRATHELGQHARKAINGFKTDLPVLGSGMYIFNETESSDYLTFEEGYAVLMESAMTGEEGAWKSTDFNFYLGKSFADEGDDFRAVFEKTWRFNLLYSLSDGRDVTDEMIQKQRSAAYNSCVRIFRGTPVDAPEVSQGSVLTYGKDLAYFVGRIKAMRYVKELYETRDTASLDCILLGKFDPTDTAQREIAMQAFKRANLL